MMNLDRFRPSRWTLSQRWIGGVAGAAALLGIALVGQSATAGPESASAETSAPAEPAASAVATLSPRSPAARGSRAAVSCLMSPSRVADIGTPVIGVVASVKVDTGDVVEEGQLLLSLRDEVESANVKAASTRAGIEADERAAVANLELADQRLGRSTRLEQQGFVSSQATEQARAEREVAAQRLEQARSQKQVSRRELGVVKAQLGQRAVRSPFDGVVIERFVNAGERVEDKPMLRIARLDPLRVELLVPASRYGTIRLRDRISVQPELPNVAPVAATVTRIDKVIDGASNTFRVRLNLPNPNQTLPAGARCRVQLPGADAAPASSNGVAPAASLGGRARPAG